MGCMFGSMILLVLTAAALIIGLVFNALGIARFSLDQFQWVFPLGGMLMGFLILMIVTAAFYVRRMSVHFDDLLVASNRVAGGDYAARVAERGTTEMRSLANAFNAMASRLEVNEQQRRAMLADVSHELRTPLTVIRGNIEGILDGVYPADGPRLNSILEETQILSRLVEDLRTLALAESGSLQLRPESADLNELIRETVTAFHSQADTAGVQVELSLAEGLPPLEVDPERIRQVLSNLVVNAMHYTPRGGRVSITSEQVQEGPDRFEEVAIEDNGPGILEADLPHVFDRFYKAADSRGMGLGLSISKLIIEAHGGQIRASSLPSGGAKISFSLPLISLVK
jgi:two-component system sensor histidine kinase BaeS